MRHKLSGSSALGAGRATPSTLWIFPEGQLTAFRATGRRNVVITGADGKPVTIAFLWTMQDGSTPSFDPEKARYATSDYVANVAPSANVTIFGGDTCSAKRLLGGKHLWKSTMDFDEALAHQWLSPGVTRELITSSYALLRAIHGAIEI